MGNTVKIEKRAAECLRLRVGGFLVPHVLHFSQAQDKALDEAERFTSRWFDRRHAATRTALQAAGQLRRADFDSGATQSILQDWHAQSVERLAEDASDWIALWSNCASLFAKGEIEAEEEIIDMTDKDNGARRLLTRIPV